MWLGPEEEVEHPEFERIASGRSTNESTNDLRKARSAERCTGRVDDLASRLGTASMSVRTD